VPPIAAAGLIQVCLWLAVSASLRGAFLEEYIEKDILLDQINVLFKLRKYI
jgi:hypothetical protein